MMQLLLLLLLLLLLCLPQLHTAREASAQLGAVHPGHYCFRGGGGERGGGRNAGWVLSELPVCQL
jgi:hypothetical protein